jgi:hypothetical protein
MNKGKPVGNANEAVLDSNACHGAGSLNLSRKEGALWPKDRQAVNPWGANGQGVGGRSVLLDGARLSG